MIPASRQWLVAVLTGLAVWAGGARADELSERLVTVNVKDAELIEVATLINEMAGVSIVAHKDVQTEKITISLKDMPVQAALQAICEVYDLALNRLPDSGTYIIKRADAKASGGRVVSVGSPQGQVTGVTTVAPRPEVVLPPAYQPAARPGGTERAETRPSVRQPHLTGGQPGAYSQKVAKVRDKIQVKYIRASEIAAMFGMEAWETTLTGGRRLYRPTIDVPRTFVDLGDTINRHNRFISQSTGNRAVINPRTIPMMMPYGRDQFGEEAGAGGPAAGPGGGGRAGGRQGGGAVFELPEGIDELVGFDLISALIVVGDPQAIEDLKELIEMLDVPPLQIEVEARFVTLSVSDAQAFGIVWSVTDGINAVSGSTPSAGGASIAFQTATGNFQTLITAILRGNKGKLVNAPKVATQNGQPAVVAFQQTIPVTLSDTVITDASQTVSTSVATIPVTTALQVVPRVTGAPPNESITTVISPQVADVTGFVDNPGGGTIPIVATQQIQTLLRVNNGETIALGGLVRKNNSNSSTKIPFLGDLPFIGQLFRSRTNNVDESELLIFLTPTIIRELNINTGPPPVG